MYSLEVNFEYEAPAEAVWALLEDFGNVARWWPQNDPVFPLNRCEVEGVGIGMIRKFYVGTSTRPTCERLDYLDPAQRVLKLSIIGDAPAGLTWYQATGRVESLTESRCRYSYRGKYTTDAETPDQPRAFLLAAYALLDKGIKEALSRELDRHA